MNLLHGDCLELMKDIPDNSIDLCLTDPPYGTTQCKWDSVIPFKPMWEQLKRIVKDNGVICLFGSEPFSSLLRVSNLKMFKYDWIWAKTQAVGHLNAYKMPMKRNELLSIFYTKPPSYYPVLSDKPVKDIRPHSKSGLTDNYGGYNQEQSKNRKIPLNKKLPDSILTFANAQKTVHPTQKPVPLLEYLIKTYTLEGETVLDFAAGSGSTGEAAKRLNRECILMEKELKYFEIAKKRLGL